MRMKRVGVIGILITSFSTLLQAQSPDSPVSVRCGLRETTSRCRAWTLFDVAFLQWRGGTKHEFFTEAVDTLGNQVRFYEPDLDREGAITVGRMQNRSSRLATGFSVALGAGPVVIRGEGRTRMWLSDHASIDLSAGVFERGYWPTAAYPDIMVGPTAAISVKSRVTGQTL